jgi:hypothetical protein
MARGLKPLPIMPGTKRPGSWDGGRWKEMDGWTKVIRDRMPTDDELARWGQREAGISVLCGQASGDVVALDVDTDDKAIQAAIVAVLPEGYEDAPTKRGKKGMTLFFRGPGLQTRQWRMPSKDVPGKRDVICEILAGGKMCILPPTIHPDTREPYAWVNGHTLEEFDPSDLLTLPADIAVRLTKALEAFGYGAEEREHSKKQNREQYAGTTYGQVNNAALRDLGAWFPKLGLARTIQQGNAWRAVASWRPSSDPRLPEGKRGRALSARPDGIRDFAEDEPYTPIDLVMAALKRPAHEAVQWLCDILGIQLRTPKQAQAERKRRTVDLAASVVLMFDDQKYAGREIAVGDVLADMLWDPKSFEGATLADPIKGVSGGKGVAKVVRLADGAVQIHSVDAGGPIYQLRWNQQWVRKALGRGEARDDVKAAFLRLTLASGLDEDDVSVAVAEALQQMVDSRGRLDGTTGRQLWATLRALQEERAEVCAEEARQQRRVERERVDKREFRPVPAGDAEKGPVLRMLSEVLGKSKLVEPPIRDIDDHFAYKRLRHVPGMHPYSASSGNAEPPTEAESRLPMPEQLLLTRMSPDEVNILNVEKHIGFYAGKDERLVSLPLTFVRPFLRWNDQLPRVATIVTSPVVLADGVVLGQQRGLDKERGILFAIPAEVMGVVPRRDQCDAEEVARAMHFLTDVWLVDVEASYRAKCVMIAGALSLIERTLLDDRPTFWTTAGRRGGGKSTAMRMLIYAVTGLRAAAASWSTDEEERRKALFSYLLAGVSYILWDNIPNGLLITCPHIEKSCTTALVVDRMLGVSQTVATSASVIQFFTGNNIGPKGDLARRSLQARIEITRPVPENREFKHNDPIGWTEAHRGEILRAMYTILLGNPSLRLPRSALMATGFKMWQRTVGSAIEHAAACVTRRAFELDTSCGLDSAKRPHDVAFKQLFLAQEQSDSESVGTLEALRILQRLPQPFTGSDVAKLINSGTDDGVNMRQWLYGRRHDPQITPTSVGMRLGAREDAVAQDGSETLFLRLHGRDRANRNSYWIEIKREI